MAERYLEIDHPTIVAFAALPLGEVAELALDELTPTISDDFTRSHTEGPIEVYGLRVLLNVRPERVGKVVLWIADGNHRYHEELRNGGLTIAAMKVVPREDNDIRYMFNSTERWNDLR